MGVFWFRLADSISSCMPRMIRWPRKKSNQKITADTEDLALAA